MNFKKTGIVLSALTLSAALSSFALADTATVTAEKSANIREGAGTKHKVIGWAMRGDTFETLGTSGNWTKVQLDNGKEGYIYTKLLNTESSASGETAAVTAEVSANVRDNASMSGKVIGWAMNGEKVTVLEKGSKWTKVELANGTVGYIHNSLLGDKAPSAPSTPSDKETAVITAEVSANVRAKASMNGSVIGWAMKDDEVTVLEKGSKWTKVELEDGTVGYIHNSMLSIG